MFAPCFVMQYLVSFLALQSSRVEKKGLVALLKFCLLVIV